MKINPDCIRDVLLCLEKNLTINSSTSTMNSISLLKLKELMSSQYNNRYNNDDIWYSVYLLHQVGYIEADIINSGTYTMIKCSIRNITWQGHQFLNDIKPQAIWQVVKDKASELGGMSINGLKIASRTAIEEMVKNPDFCNDIIAKIKSII